MMHEPRNRVRARWTPEMEPDRRSLQTLFAFAYGMQVGRMRHVAAELQKLAQQAQLATMAAGAAIAIAAQNQIECIARSGGAAPQLGSKPEATVGLSGECIRTGIPQFCADTETHPFVDRMHSRTFGVRSIVYVPLFRGVQPAGVIGVFSDKPGHFTQHDMRVLQLIGREVTKTLNWEPNPNAMFPAASAVVTPPEPAVIAAAAAMPSVEQPSHPDPVQVAEAFASPLPEVREQADVFAEPLTPEKEEAILVEAREILEASQSSAKELEPPPGADAGAPATPVEASPVAEAELPAPSFATETWSEADDSGYPASVPSFLFSEEKRVPTWAIALGAIAIIAAVFFGIWRLMPLWSPKEDQQMVYGPPRVTKEAGDAALGQAPAATGDLAKVAVRPSIADSTGPAAKAKAPLGPLAYVQNVATQTVGGHTFVSVHLTGPAQFEAPHALTNPDRIYIDLHDVEVSPALKDAKIAGVGPIADFRFSKSAENVVRLVMVLDAPCTYLVTMTNDPYVIVFDVQPLRMPRPGAAKRNSSQEP